MTKEVLRGRLARLADDRVKVEQLLRLAEEDVEKHRATLDRIDRLGTDWYETIKHMEQETARN